MAIKRQWWWPWILRRCHLGCAGELDRAACEPPTVDRIIAFDFVTIELEDETVWLIEDRRYAEMALTPDRPIDLWQALATLNLQQAARVAIDDPDLMIAYTEKELRVIFEKAVLDTGGQPYLSIIAAGTFGAYPTKSWCIYFLTWGCYYCTGHRGYRLNDPKFIALTLFNQHR